MNRADVGVGLIGLGRIGALHGEHLAGSISGARLVAAVVAPDDRQAAAASAPCPLLESVEELVAHAEVDAVVIASPTNLHDRHVELAASAGKAIFCEKPLADTVDKAGRAAEAIERSGVPFQIGFQRRFDPGYARAREIVASGVVGEPELFRGISSDYMPPVTYLRTSGGLFWDLGVHDFDAARFLMGKEIEAVRATGSILVEPALAEFDDVDYGVVTLRFEGGALGVVQNSWRAPWGYEIRAEVCGSRGRVVTELDERVPTRLYTAEGFRSERYHQFVERFREAYRIELQAFVDALRRGAGPTPGVRDGLQALRASHAATLSRREDRWIVMGDEW